MTSPRSIGSGRHGSPDPGGEVLVTGLYLADGVVDVLRGLHRRRDQPVEPARHVQDVGTPSRSAGTGGRRSAQDITNTN